MSTTPESPQGAGSEPDLCEESGKPRCADCDCSGDGHGGSASGSALTAVIGTITVEVFRYRPDREGGPWTDTFEVPYGTETSIVDALNWIKDTQDPSLAFRWSCRMGVCGSCGVMVNDRPTLGCETFVRNYAGKRIRIEPLENFDVERDLVVDMAPFLESMTAVKPWIVPGPDAPDGSPGREGYTQTPEQMLDYHSFAQCINCLLCYAACPQVGIKEQFLGPAAIAAAIRYNKDSRDQGDALRLPVLDRQDGVWPCTFVGACSTVCPKGVDPAAAVQSAKLTAATEWTKEFIVPHKGGHQP